MGALFLTFPPNLHRSFIITSQRTSQSKLHHRRIAIINGHGAGRGKLKLTHLKVLNNVVSAATTDPSQAVLTWQIVAGSLASVVPFVVALIEFSKRIVEQRNCSVCKGSGLVLRDNKRISAMAVMEEVLLRMSFSLDLTLSIWSFPVYRF